MISGMSIALLAGAIFSIAWGASVLESLASDASSLITRPQTDNAVWLLIGGIVLAIVGLFSFVCWFKGKLKRLHAPA